MMTEGDITIKEEIKKVEKIRERKEKKKIKNSDKKKGETNKQTDK